MIRVLIACVTLIAAVPAWAEINIKEVTSPGGITAWLVEEPSIPFVAFEIRFRGGTSLDAEGKLASVGSTVDEKEATYSNAIGAGSLRGYWQDPAFDPGFRVARFPEQREHQKSL